MLGHEMDSGRVFLLFWVVSLPCVYLLLHSLTRWDIAGLFLGWVVFFPYSEVMKWYESRFNS